MTKDLRLTITCYTAEQFDDCNTAIQQFHTYPRVTYHQYQTIYLIELTDTNLACLCSIWEAVEKTGVDLAIRNFAR